VTDNETLPPDEAFDTAVGILEEYLEHAQHAIGDGTTVEHPTTMLAVGIINMAGEFLHQLAVHRPALNHDGTLGCPSCVEMHPVLGMVRAAAPCASALSVLNAVLQTGRVETPAPGGLQVILQDGTEPYVSLGASEVERMCGLSPAQARSASSAVVQAISRVRRRARHH